jgi:hypothetical protein
MSKCSAFHEGHLENNTFISLDSFYCTGGRYHVAKSVHFVAQTPCHEMDNQLFNHNYSSSSTNSRPMLVCSIGAGQLVSFGEPLAIRHNSAGPGIHKLNVRPELSLLIVSVLGNEVLQHAMECPNQSHRGYDFRGGIE